MWCAASSSLHAAVAATIVAIATIRALLVATLHFATTKSLQVLPGFSTNL